MGRWCVGVGVLVEKAYFCLGEGTPSWAPRVAGLSEVRGVTVRPIAHIRVLASLWKSWAPLKVIVFSWQLLHDRISSCQSLLSHRVLVIPKSAICALFGWYYVSLRDVMGHFEAFVGLGWIGDTIFGLNAPLVFGSLVRLRVTLAPYMNGRRIPHCAGLDRGGEVCYGAFWRRGTSWWREITRIRESGKGEGRWCTGFLYVSGLDACMIWRTTNCERWLRYVLLGGGWMGRRESGGGRYRWQWQPDPDAGYTVRGAYQLLTSHTADTTDEAIQLIWHPRVPLKVSIFAWRLLRDLVTRVILSPTTHFFVSGCGAAESAHHLFISCGTFGSLWASVSSWIDITLVDSTSLRDHFVQFISSAGGFRALRSFLQLIWLACVWVEFRSYNVVRSSKRIRMSARVQKFRSSKMFRCLQEFRRYLLVMSYSEDVQKLKYEGLSEAIHSRPIRLQVIKGSSEAKEFPKSSEGLHQLLLSSLMICSKVN
ncbi:hypothetical protein TSUD_99000 [Trifolium subterraneum]|uniref:Reverse transcriptase zinc-binding domain-containing protein n=1 Tax=Trifolium subterraneum TaxID=3900 RepID=A0A2Z6PEE0_TRISU|nr:hypothetical protein TSUD_99000 [Trifolium subterraneum]